MCYSIRCYETGFAPKYGAPTRLFSRRPWLSEEPKIIDQKVHLYVSTVEPGGKMKPMKDVETFHY